MAFTVEDGTGSASANAYVSVAYCDSWHSDRGATAWTGTDTVKEQAIVRATDYLDRRYNFVGTKASTDQALEWPRANVEDPWGRDYAAVPEEVKRACAEAALLALSNDLIPTPTYDAIGQATMKREKVGPIETEASYQTGAAPLKRWPHIDLILKKFIIKGGTTVRG